VWGITFQKKRFQHQGAWYHNIFYIIVNELDTSEKIYTNTNIFISTFPNFFIAWERNSWSKANSWALDFLVLVKEKRLAFCQGTSFDDGNNHQYSLPIYMSKYFNTQNKCWSQRFSKE
jgi:hypothetical protein